MDVSESANPPGRSRAVSTAYTAITLALFFGVGLGGGAAYRYWTDAPDRPLADRGAAAVQPQWPVPAAKPSLANTAAPEGARSERSRPAPALPVAAAAAAKTSPAAPAVTAEMAPTPPAPIPDAETAAAPLAPAPVAAAPIPPRKPRLAARASRPAPASTQQIAAHAPSSVPGNLAAYRVQFGAFADEDNVRRVQWAIEASGLAVEVSQAQGASGHPLYFLRSPAYPDYAAALSAAKTVQERVGHFVNAIPIDYVIFGGHAAPEQQADAR